MSRINIGCGRTPTKGWRNLDNSLSLRLAAIPLLSDLLRKLGLLGQSSYDFIRFIRENRIELADATKRLPAADASVDVVYSSHMLEHLDREGAKAFLEETLRVLRPGGILRIAVPDIEKMVDCYKASGDADAFLEATNLCKPRPRRLVDRLKLLVVGPRNHQWMYDGKSLSRLLESHGFVNVRSLPPGQTSIPAPEPLDLEERASESVYVEGEKTTPK